MKGKRMSLCSVWVFIVLVLDPVCVDVCVAMSLGKTLENITNQSNDLPDDVIKQKLKDVMIDSLDINRITSAFHSAPQDGNVREFLRHMITDGLTPEGAWLLEYVLSHKSIRNPMLLSLFWNSEEVSRASPDLNIAWSFIDSLARGEAWNITSHHTNVTQHNEKLNTILESHFSRLSDVNHDIAKGAGSFQMLIKDLERENIGLDSVSTGSGPLTWQSFLSGMIDLPAVANLLNHKATAPQDLNVFLQEDSTTESIIEHSQNEESQEHAKDSPIPFLEPPVSNRKSKRSVRQSQRSVRSKVEETVVKSDESNNPEGSEKPDVGFADTFNVVDDGTDVQTRIQRIDSKLRWILYGTAIATLVAVIIFSFRTTATFYAGSRCDSTVRPEQEWLKSLCKTESITIILSLLFDVLIMICGGMLLLTLHTSISVSASEQSSKVSTIVSDALKRQVAERAAGTSDTSTNDNTQTNFGIENLLGLRTTKKNLKTPEGLSKPEKLPGTSVSALEENTFLEFWSKAKTVKNDVVDSITLDDLTPQQKEEFKKEIKTDMTASSGVIDLHVLRQLMEKVLKLNPKTVGSILRKLSNSRRSISVGELRDEVDRGSISFSSNLTNSMPPLLVSTILFVMSLSLLLLTNNEVASTFAMLSFFALIVCVGVASSIIEGHKKKSLEPSEAETMFGEIVGKKILKLALVLTSVMCFSAVYYSLRTCSDQFVMCDNGAWPICVSSGFPPRRFQCNADKPICDWSSGLDNSHVVVCPNEEVVGGIGDRGEFFKIFTANHIPLSVPSRNFSIGMAHGFDASDIRDSKLLAYLKHPTKTYAYVEEGKFTWIQNILQNIPTSVLPSNGSPAIIDAIRLALPEQSCTSTTQPTRLELSFNAPITSVTNKMIREAKSLAIYTPDGSNQSNYLMCYHRTGDADNLWSPVPNAWVVVAPLGGCSDPDCSSSDFSSGLRHRYFDAFYYSLIVQSTIGYGDILAVSSRARLLTAMQGLVMFFLQSI